MKRCAKCDAEYEDAYDSCRVCAKGDQIANAGKAISGCGGAITAIGLLVFLFLCVLSSCAR